MAFVSGFSCSGLVHACHPKLPFGIQGNKETGYNNCNAVRPICRTILRGRIHYIPAKHFRSQHILSVRRGDYQLSYEGDLPKEPFWASLVNEVIGDLKSLFVFLIEQPSQLKYIEWPSFKSTLKTAILTLVIVALLIVALSSVDSAFCYLLALVLRRTP